MDLQHTFTVPIGIEEAWTAFNDLEGIAPCCPGAVITSVDGDDFTGTAKVKLGPIALMDSGKGQWVSRDNTAYHAVIEAMGKDKRGNGTASATISARLESQGPSLTTVVVDTDLRITGRPAQFGRGVIQDVGGKILDQFATCLSTRMGQADEPVAVEPVVAEPVVAEAVAVEPVAAEPVVAEPVVAEAVVVEPVMVGSRPAAPKPVPAYEPLDLDLGGVVGPVLFKRYGPTAAACLVTAVITWLVARRR